MTITISIDGQDNEAIAALIYEHYKKQGDTVRLCRRPDHKPVHEIKRFYNLCNHEIALLHAFDQSLTSYKLFDWGDYDIIVWQGSILTDYLELIDENTSKLFIKQINKYTPKMDTYYYIKDDKQVLKNNIFNDFKNIVILNKEDGINTLYKTIINHLNETYPHCKWCNHIYKKHNANQKYCSKTCSKLSREKQNRDNRNKFYKKYKNVLSPHEKNTLGSNALLKEHAHDNFNIEHDVIKREKHRLQLD